MKKFLLFVFGVFVFNSCFSQTPNWQWAISAGGLNPDVAWSVSADHSENVYIAGYFNSPSITFGSTVLTGNTSGDMFIAKYDGSGNALWAKSAWGFWHDEATSVTVDESNNVYVAGFFSSYYIIMDSDTLFNPSASAWDVFLIKMDSSGNIIWTKSFGGNNHENITDITMDSSNNVYISGTFASASVTFGAFTLINAGGTNMFIVKLDSTGNVLWAKNSVGVGWVTPHSIRTDNSNNIYVVGSFNSPDVTLDTITLPNSYAPTALMFFAKYDLNGNIQWAKSGGNNSGAIASAVTTDSFNNIYIAGTYGDTLILESDTLIQSDTSNLSSHSDLFLSKYTSTGNKLWLKNAGGNTDIIVSSIVADNNSNVFLTGYYVSRITLVPGDTLATYIIFGNDTLMNLEICSPNYEIFIANYDFSGNVIWADRIGSCSDDYGRYLTTNLNGNTFLTGWFGDTILIGSSSLISNGADLYLAKLNTSTVNINQYSIENNILDFTPNPFTTSLILKNTTQKGDVAIFDVTGKEILRQKTFAAETKINTAHLSPGFYVVKYAEENKIVTRKAVKAP